MVLTGAAYFKLNSNITRVDVSKQLGIRPSDPGKTAASAATEPVNILILGSDTRKGLGTDAYGDDTIEGGDHSDTNLLVHLSGDRTWATVVSIPRDSMTPAPPDCSPDVPFEQWTVRQWNYNYRQGGAGCTIRTLEGNTGVFVDHYAAVNFTGFASMVDALGGIEVCTKQAIEDPASGLSLTPGRHTLDGKDALAYVRARKTLGDGSDIGRIHRQQAFMSSVVQKATATSILLRPDRLYAFLDAATKSLTTDPALDTGEMKDIALSLRKLQAKDVTFVTVPIQEYPADPNRVEWAPAADQIWEEIKADRRLGSSTTPSPSAAASSMGPLTVSPQDIAVQVLNASGVRGLAGQVSAALTVQGFKSVTVGDAAVTDGAKVFYSQGQAEAARTVAAAFPGATMIEQEGLGEVIQVVLGRNSPDVVEIPNRLGTAPLPTPTVHASSAPLPSPSVGSWDAITPRTADQDICS